MMIRIQAPASSANVGTGIDCLGLAIPLYLTVDVELSDKNQASFGKGFSYPLENKDNLVLTSFRRAFDTKQKVAPNIKMAMSTEIPVSRGLGSSSSAIIAGILAANELGQLGLNDEEIIDLATKIEGHPDNVLACYYGGFTIGMQDGDHVLSVKMDPGQLRAVVAIPDFELSTVQARSVLPDSVTRNTAVSEIQRACLLVAALSSGNSSYLHKATDDLIFTPARLPLIPGGKEVMEAALKAGALCSMISGAGPTIIALCNEKEKEVAFAMETAFRCRYIGSTTKVLPLSNIGATIERIGK